jgi:3-oxoacyl-[acyl-carrier protein] reductase
MRSDNPVAVVTGGTGGIGAATAKALAAAGFSVAVGFRRSATAAESPKAWPRRFPEPDTSP